ncbi:pilus assembly FimT family protein [Fontivita pretiosa]|uniref:pilus assembly FimT family protein n=1 Tax=Fontivita pretiosa TaxID=2989684 RepID=UPI003D17B1E8
MSESGQWSVIRDQFNRHGGRAPHRAATLASGHRSLATAFSMTELLIVIGIIVLVLAVAMPAFNLITGTKSNEMAINQISAFLARARNEAIGLQQYRGVFFYLDPRNFRVTMALVGQAERGTPPYQVDLYLDLVGGDTQPLPKGVGVQFIDDGGSVAAGNLNDRYIGFNNVNGHRQAKNPPNDQNGILRVRYGGVILFDSTGKVAHRSYALLCKNGLEYTAMGRLLYNDNLFDRNLARDVVPVDILTTPELALRSQLGFVLFDLDAFKNQFGGDNALGDWQITRKITPSAYAATEAPEEQWLDANAVPVLINRYNGTIVKGE